MILCYSPLLEKRILFIVASLSILALILLPKINSEAILSYYVSSLFLIYCKVVGIPAPI